MRKVFLAVLTALGAVLAGSVLADSQTNPRFSSPALGFSVVYPDTWRVQQNQAGRRVSFVDVARTTGFLTSVTVSSSPVASGVTLKSANAIVQGRLKTSLKDFKLFQNQPSTLGGTAATQLLYTAQQGKLVLAGFVIYTVRSGRLYEFSFECDRQNYERLRALGGMILGSFSFL